MVEAAMKMLTGTALQKKIRDVAQGTRVYCAVAFWGAGADELIGPAANRDVKLICNLRMGGTNPATIAQLLSKGVEVRQSDTLHAKVYIGDKIAVVTSANASINGLALEGNELGGWVEAGAIVPVKDALSWFMVQWDGSREILDSDIANAKTVFRNRRINRPSRTFAQFDPHAEDTPLVYWVDDPFYKNNESEIKQQLGQCTLQTLERIKNGIIIEGPQDKDLPPGTWVFNWWRNENGSPNESQDLAPYWTCASGIVVEKAITYDDNDDPTDIMLGIEVMPPEPFDLTDPLVRTALIKVINQKKYKGLRSALEDYNGSFITKFRELMKDFWQDAHKYYLEKLLK